MARWKYGDFALLPVEIVQFGEGYCYVQEAEGHEFGVDPLDLVRIPPSKDSIREAVNESCTCGGLGPSDGACAACMVWHLLTYKDES